MAILIGVDEAGYGPNYGPLVVAATAWRVGERSDQRSEARGQRLDASALAEAALQTSARAAASSPVAIVATDRASVTDGAPIDLYKLLRGAVTRRAAPGGAALCRKRIAIADSKLLYKPGAGLALLECGVHAALRCSGAAGVEDREALIAHLEADLDNARSAHRWQRGEAQPLPRDLDAEDAVRAGELLEACCERAGVRPLAIRARMIYPAQFNELVDQHGTKGAALSHVTLELVRRVVDALSTHAASEDAAARDDCDGGCERVHITCDKHGGRNHYAALLQHHFADSWIDVLGEARAVSRYAWDHGDIKCEAEFRVGGEAALPAALASMTAKYLRELAMHEFNAFWTARIPGLRPTAGYPRDSRRFQRDIAAEQRRLGIDERVIWRSR